MFLENPYELMKTYIIAEIGINHNGSLDNCLRLIDAATAAGCQAVKFQSFSAKHLYPKTAGKLDWKDADKEFSYDIYEAVKKFEMPLEWIDVLIDYCSTKNLDFISSVFDVNGLDFLLKKGARSIKLSSYTITHLPLIEACAKADLPIIMSTGGATLGETEKAVETVLRYHDKLSLLHCSIQYPTKLEDCNLGVIETLKLAFPGLATGYSDHTMEISDAPVQAVYLGSNIIEKHITLDKKMTGPDHFFALDPDELKKMVQDIKKAGKEVESGTYLIDRTMYGNSAKICHENERYLRDFCYMTLFANKPIKKGQRIRPEDLAILRPGKKKRGLNPEYVSLFENNEIHAGKDIEAEDPIRWESIF